MKPSNDWNTGPPPNEILVEVKEGDKIIRVMAFYGRDGYRPHWTNGSTNWPVEAFRRWRFLKDQPEKAHPLK